MDIVECSLQDNAFIHGLLSLNDKRRRRANKSPLLDPWSSSFPEKQLISLPMLCSANNPQLWWCRVSDCRKVRKRTPSQITTASAGAAAVHFIPLAGWLLHLPTHFLLTCCYPKYDGSEICSHDHSFFSPHRPPPVRTNWPRHCHNVLNYITL